MQQNLIQELLSKNIIKYGNPIGQFTNYKQKRGMSLYHDWIDWLGGYPFEVARPEQVLRFYRSRAFALDNMTTCGGRHGCNEYVFRRCREGSSHCG